MDEYAYLKKAIEEFLEFIDIRPMSVRSYKSILNRYMDYLTSNRISKPTRRDIITYREYLWDQNLKASTIAKIFTVIKAFYRWARIHARFYGLDETFLYDVTEGVKSVKINPHYKKEALSVEQVKTLLSYLASKTTNIIGQRNYAMVLLMLTTGLRTIEIARAKKRDISTIGKTHILYVHGKGEDEANQFVKLPVRLTDAIASYLAMRTDTNPHVFTAHTAVKTAHTSLSKSTIRKIITHALKQCGLYSSRVTAHSLRHTAATINLMRGGSLEATRQLLRHKHIASTLVYAHQIERIKDDSETCIENIYFDEGDQV